MSWQLHSSSHVVFRNCRLRISRPVTAETVTGTVALFGNRFIMSWWLHNSPYVFFFFFSKLQALGPVTAETVTVTRNTNFRKQWRWSVVPFSYPIIKLWWSQSPPHVVLGNAPNEMVGPDMSQYANIVIVSSRLPHNPLIITSRQT